MKKLFSVLALLSCLCLSSCFDMQYDDVEEYYEFFDNTVYLDYYLDDGVTFEDTDVNMDEYFLNEKTQNKFDPDCLVDSEHYAYMAICLDKDETAFDDFCLYIKAEEAVLMEMRIFIVDNLPSKGRGFNAPPKVNVNDYDDEYSDPIATVSLNLTPNEFRDIFIDKWTVSENITNHIVLKPNQYFLIQFYNNTGYGADDNFKNFKFTMTNLVLSKVKK